MTDTYRPAFPGRSVLVVDPDIERRKARVSELRKNGFDVRAAYCYHQAAEKLYRYHQQEKPINLLVTSLIFPDGSGRQLCLDFASLRKSGELKIAIVAECELGKLEHDSFERIADHVCEHISPDELVHLARRLMRIGTRPAPPSS